MKKLLNTLYITSPEYYLSLDGENFVVSENQTEKFRIPFGNIENVVCMSFPGISPGLMGKCARLGIPISVMSPYGKHLATIVGETRGNVHLRRQQYRMADEKEASLGIAKNIVAAKLHNTLYVLSRVVRDHKEKIDIGRIELVISGIKENIDAVFACENVESLRGVEGKSASQYFSVFDSMILKQKEHFHFVERSKHPALDPTNVMLSFLYTVLTFDIKAALESVGLDPYVGFLHTDRAGRVSLACDLIEELRATMVDRLVLSLINLNQVSAKNFLIKEGGGVIMDEHARKALLQAYQAKKNEEFVHPYIQEKIKIGLIPYVQAQLLAKHIRGDLDEYPPFLKY